MSFIKDTGVYRIKSPVVASDIVIGTNSELANGETVNYAMEDIAAFALAGLSPEIGGTLKVGEIEYDGLLTDVSDVINIMNPDYTIQSYEALFIRVNNARYVCKLQDVTVGFGETPTTQDDFIFLSNIQGPAGENGNVWRNGAGVPSNDLGADGDYYLNNTNGDVYLRTATVYAVVANIKGPTGNTGATGATGETGATGAPGPSALNLQKTETSSFTLDNDDNNYTVMLNNGATPITVTVPAGLLENISICFVQLGTADVTFATTGGSVINTPIGNKIKGQYFWAYLEQRGTTNTYQLLGNLKI
jgi:hypothetical protein